MTTHLYFTDVHTQPGISNRRASWLSKLIIDVKPDVVINGGDQPDLYSLNSYDKGKGSFHGASYQADIESSLDFDAKLFEPIRKRKKKRPRFVYTVGNHCQRIEKVINQEPHLAGHKYGINDCSICVVHSL